MKARFVGIVLLCCGSPAPAAAELLFQFVRTVSTVPQSLNYYPLDFSAAELAISITPQDMGASYFATPAIVSHFNASLHQVNNVHFGAFAYNGALDDASVPEQPGIYQEQFSTLSRERLVPNLGPGIEGYRITAIQQVITDYQQILAQTVPAHLYRASAKQTLRLYGDAIPPVPGDFNRSGDVDAADYVLWRNYRNTDYSFPNESGQSPGFAWDEDYDYWRSQFGHTAFASGSGLSVAIIPEPATWLLIMLGLVLGANLRLRERP